MKFAMLTTFFGPHSFGGDAAFVDRLSRALARHGHEVHVIYCRDAFEVVKGDQTPRPYEAPPGVTIHPLSSPVGAALAAGDAPDGDAGVQGEGDPAAPRRDRAGRGPLPQPLAGRRAGAAGSPSPRGRQADDGARTLAGLPDARPLEV